MSDSIDRAAQDSAIYEAAALNNALSQLEACGPVTCGYCHFCGEPVPSNASWCDAQCRDDWQAEQDAAERRGQIGGVA